jgi:hypothetical protein
MPKILTAAAAALALVLAPPAFAQDTLNSNSGSAANANSGSASGAESNGNVQGQTQNNAGIGSSASRSDSASGAVSGSASDSRSASDQTQGQALDNRNSNTATNSSTVGQQASNQQGVSVATTFNTTNHKRSYVSTNTAVPLAASSSFSSDYCGGTVSGGASAAPIGISIGGSGPVFDKSCQSLRRAEKFGMAAANYQNMQQPEEAMKLMSLMVWSICTSDSSGPKADKATANACAQILQMGGPVSPANDNYSVPAAPPMPAPAPVTPLETQKPNVTPMAPVEPDWNNLPPKTPRGEIKRDDAADTALAARNMPPSP